MTPGRAAAVALAVALFAHGTRASAAPTTAETLREASAALTAGDHARAAQLAGPLVGAQVDRADRSEAWRVYGLALFFLGRTAEAEAALVEHMKLEPDTHLDPARFPPEVIVFFEDVRSRHAAEIGGSRGRPDTPREKAKNLFPPWGQIQNGEHGKAIAIGAAELLLLATNITTAALLYRWCGTGAVTCHIGQQSRRDQAIQARRINIASAALLVATYAYGVIDGFYHHGRRRGERSYMSLGVDPSRDGAALVLGWQF